MSSATGAMFDALQALGVDAPPGTGLGELAVELIGQLEDQGWTLIRPATLAALAELAERVER